MTAGTPTAAHNPVRRILWARGLRDFGDGLAAVLLPAYLVALGYGAAEVGVVATIALLGSALMTLAVDIAGAVPIPGGCCCSPPRRWPRRAWALRPRGASP